MRSTLPAAILAAFVVAAPAQAAFPGTNGRIAFQSQNSLGTINAVGGDRRPLIMAPGLQLAAPAWSANGQRIAYLSNRDGGAMEIYVTGPEGVPETRLTNNPAEESAPSWSPDGTRIAFESDRDDANGEIYTMGADGSNVQRLTSILSTDGAPAWAPDGTRIAFSSSRAGAGNTDIWVMGADGGAPTRLTTDGADETNPDWSPDGTRIVFQRGTGLVTMGTNGSGQTPLVADGARPAWSPDGSKIAFDRASELHAINPDGSGATPLTTAGTPALVASNPSWQPIPIAPPGGGGPGPGGPVDADHDGVSPPLDCDDTDPAVRPGARDIRGDKIDQDCAGGDALKVTNSRISGVTATYPISRYTAFTSLTAKPVRKGDRLRLSCRGGGCTFKTKSISVKKRARKLSLLKHVRGMKLRSGAVVQLRVTRPGTIGRVRTWKVRAPKIPKITDRCVQPGAKKLIRCPRG